MNKLRDILMSTAREKGICLDGYKEMRSDDIESLIDFYLANPDWCLERDYPSLQILEKHFSDNEGKGIFIGKTFRNELLDDRQVYIFHNCNGVVKVGLNVEKGLIPMLYVANGCCLTIEGSGEWKPKSESGRSLVPVYVFGENKVEANDNEYVRFSRYYSDLI